MENEKTVDENLRRRVGQFEISSALVGSSNLSDLIIFMRDVFVIRCEHIYDRGLFSYTALSPHFEEVPEGEEPPLYISKCTRHADESITVKWEKV